MPISPEEFQILLPLAAEWAQDQESGILRNGTELRDDQISDAGRAGVAHPERIRLLRVAAVPLPANPALARAAAEVGLINPNTIGMALRYGIFLRADHWDDRLTFVHECVHTSQYERLGGFQAFLGRYLTECATIGYPAAPMEQEAILTSTAIVG